MRTNTINHRREQARRREAASSLVRKRLAELARHPQGDLGVFLHKFLEEHARDKGLGHELLFLDPTSLARHDSRLVNDLATQWHLLCRSEKRQLIRSDRWVHPYRQARETCQLKCLDHADRQFLLAVSNRLDPFKRSTPRCQSPESHT